MSIINVDETQTNNLSEDGPLSPMPFSDLASTPDRQSQEQRDVEACGSGYNRVLFHRLGSDVSDMMALQNNKHAVQNSFVEDLNISEMHVPGEGTLPKCIFARIPVKFDYI